MAALIPFLLGLLVTAGVLVPLILRLRGVSAEANERAESLAGELARIQASQRQVQADQQSLTQFLKEFPHLARDLFSGIGERQIPPTLVRAVHRSLEPAHTLLLVKRGRADGEGEDRARYVIAAVAPEVSAYRPGTEIAADTGELGYAAEAQIVVGREDLTSETARGRIKPGPDGLPGMTPDFIAPVVFDQETLGLIVVARPKKTAGDPKAALRLIAQTGAQALHAAASYSRMRTNAEMDGLTQTFNKKHMEQALSDLIYRTACAAYDRRSRGAETAELPTVSILLFDIDHFKHYNDTNGHLAGDKLLQELAHLVLAGIRKDDLFGRFGGEEFLLVMPNTTLAQATAAAEKIRALVASRRFHAAERQPAGVLSISGGVAEYPQHGTDMASLLDAADRALYAAKRGGRNRMVTASAIAAPAVAAARRSDASGGSAPPA
jgi:diguanylate cyclase (GGDEF)-like protein